MLTNYIAVVPYKVNVEREELDHVIAALQTQLVRDVGPLWDVSCVVSLFAELDHVPPGYHPLVIVPGGTLKASDMHAFHLGAGGQPIAMVEHSDGWSLLASHELIELACDPYGTRSVRGTSIGDAKCAATDPSKVRDDGVTYTPQGQVEYLVEVCDPCQASTYTINGVLVSDFVTPHYYDPLQTSGGRPSFTGRITESRQLLKGGYISWRYRATADEIWQAFAPKRADEEATAVSPADLTIAPLSGIGPSLARNWVDHRASAADRPDARATLDEATPTKALTQAQESYALASASARDYGAKLRGDIDDILGSLAALQPVPDRDKLILLFKDLAEPSNQSARDEFAKDPKGVLVKRGIDVTGDLRTTTVPLTAEQFEQGAKALTDNNRFGPDLGPVGVAKMLPALGVHVR
ncbi:MAG TPA: hypothetical protein VGF93_14775 [Solirubrobacteraceae bacterium]